MLYLIIPPIIIVITLVLLLWYLSKKANDPVVNERVMEMEGTHKKKHFQGVREWQLRFLEKFAQRSKNNSLRMHNALHNWLQSIRASRQEVQKEKKLIEEYQEQEQVEEERIVYREEPVAERPLVTEEAVMPAKTETRHEGFGIPLMRRKQRGDEEEKKPSVPKIVPARTEEERPMVSTKATLPETKRQSGKVPEEDLISRIATNPKDFEAYEALGDFYMDNGNIKDAKECYRQVLKLSPVQRMVKIKIRRLEKILSQKGN